ncbi:MAG: DNA topoisomerase IB [Actinobacteria bacterium]|nr:DNA topoisomerase IB [Actinomycetota bacterium]
MSAERRCPVRGGEKSAVRLQRVEPYGPGYTRRRRGRGFSYHDEDGAQITDLDTLQRIRALAVPPAWRDVWICAQPGGHIQAVGTDDAGRRQYLYHDEWRRRRDAAKHDRVLRLGRRLPAVRAQIREDLNGRGLGCERVLAAALRMLDIGAFRVGGNEYAPEPGEDEGTFGLATLRREHVRLRRGAIELHYLAKGGIDQAMTLRDPVLHPVVRALLRRDGGGEDLLAYRNGRGWHDVCAEDINARLKELAGDEFSAKDLRTWNATLLAAVALAQGAAGGIPTSKRGLACAINAALDEVAEHLGNTRAVARASYVDPRVFQHYTEGRTILAAVRRAGTYDLVDEDIRAPLERALLRLLRSS